MKNEEKRKKIEEYFGKVIKDEIKQALDSRFIECPGCGNYILRKNGKCYGCGLEYNTKKGKWEKIKKEEDEEIDFLPDIANIFEDENEEDENEEDEGEL